MRDVTIWLLLANALVVATALCRREVRASLVPVRIPPRPAPFEQNPSR